MLAEKIKDGRLSSGIRTCNHGEPVMELKPYLGELAPVAER
jgi:hypothetical protein